jgi:hypothetical protein
MNRNRKVFEEGQSKSKAVISLKRAATAQESYSYGRLGGLHTIIESYGGQVLLDTPEGAWGAVNSGRVEQRSVCYWKGITLISRYVPKSKEFPINGAFYSQVYTTRTDWRKDPAMKEVMDFYQATYNRVTKLMAENRKGLSFS